MTPEDKEHKNKRRIRRIIKINIKGVELLESKNRKV